MDNDHDVKIQIDDRGYNHGTDRLIGNPKNRGSPIHDPIIHYDFLRIEIFFLANKFFSYESNF